MSRRLAVLRRMLRWTVRPVLARTFDPAFARTSFVIGAKLAFRPVRGVRSWPAEGPLAPGLWVAGRGASQSGAVLYLHGGAYVVGSSGTYRTLAGRIARHGLCRVYLPDYPLAPECPAPAAFEAALAAWRGLLDTGLRPEEIVIGGDSAGGGLALALLSRVLRDGQRPAGCFAFSPWADLTLSGASIRENADSDVLLPVSRLADVRDMVAGAVDPADSRLSPLFADFPDCPPVFLSWSGTEILRDDGARMAEALRRQGAAVDTEVLADAPHVWQLFHGFLPEADASLRRAAEFTAAALRATRRSGS